MRQGMKVAVIGGGGREHAIIQKIKEGGGDVKLYALPGNGGISEIAECVDIKATDLDGILSFCLENKVEFVVVAPDDPLVMGLVDRLEAEGIPAFGPTAAAAEIEGSKVFSKNLMKKYGIPTADYEVFDDPVSAVKYLESAEYPIVLKADGLALGKGVIICGSFDEARDGVKTIMEDKAFGKSGNRMVIESYLTGPEVSVLAFTDGNSIVPMASSMDHKRAFDGDLGPNTGGMGTIAPNPYYTDEIARTCMDEIFIKTVNAMNIEARKFKGCLYFGLMLTPSGPKVIEYNCRFGDPETQVVLPLLEGDLLEIMMAVRDERLEEASVKTRSGAAACVVLASGGYPAAYDTGKVISGLHGGRVTKGHISVYHAGTKREGDKTVTSGGRVMGVSAVAGSLHEAVNAAYEAVGDISFDGMHYRTDIGRHALEAQKVQV